MSDDRLVATDRSLGERPLVIAGRSLPFHPPIDVDCRDVSIALTGRIGARPLHCVGPRGNDNGSMGAVPGNAIIRRAAVICAIRRELTDRCVNLVEQRLYLRGVAGILSVMT